MTDEERNQPEVIGKRSPQVEAERSITAGLVTDAAIVIAPIAGAYAQAKFGQKGEPKAEPAPPPQAQPQNQQEHDAS